MTIGLVDRFGGWRSLVSGFIILSFLALAGLLAISGHSIHQFVAVAYLLVAAFVMIRVFPRQSDRQVESDTEPGFGIDSGSCGCHDLDDEDTSSEEEQR